MGAQIIENWTEIEGLVRSIAPASDIQGHVVAEIEVRSAQNVEGFANLLAVAYGTPLCVYVADDVAERTGLAPGAKIYIRIRRGSSQRIFAHPSEVRVG